MHQLISCTLFILLFASCAGSGVTVTKSQTAEYISNVFSKSKRWFRSTDGEAISADGPPPPSHLQPSEKQVLQRRAERTKTDGMSSKDYFRAISRLEKSIPELEKRLGRKNMEVGETFYTIGSMHYLQGNHQEAKNAFYKALDIFSFRLGSEHPRVWKLKDKINKIK